MKDKVALVTGSTSGIGKAIAQKLLAEGSYVIVSSEKSMDPSFLEENFTNHAKATYLKVDITKKEDLLHAREFAKREYGKLDYLVANAGVIPTPCGIDDITEEVIDNTIDTNLKGTFWTLKILGTLIQETSKAGAIVCMTSVDGIIGEPYNVIYSTTKAGIISLTKSFARHFTEPLVRVNAIAPGLIDTPLTSSTGEDPSLTTELSIIKRIGTPEEIANATIFLLSDKSSFITGQVLAVDGGFTLK